MKHPNIPPALAALFPALTPSLYERIMGPMHGPMRHLARRLTNPFPDSPALKALKVSF